MATRGRKRERERRDALFHRSRVCSGPVGFLGSLRFRYGGGRGIQTGGKQVARDEQGVLHGHYARSCPSHNPDSARTLLYSYYCYGRFYITMRERESPERVTTIYRIIVSTPAHTSVYARIVRLTCRSSTSCFRDVLKIFLSDR
jgi:hypothetical protein